MVYDADKAKLGAKTFQNFCEQFGNDVYAHVLLEILLEGIINAETIFVSGEQIQGRSETNNSPSGNEGHQFGSHRSDRIETPNSLGEADHPVYP